VTTPDDADASAAAAPLPEPERTIAFGAYGGGSHEPATPSSAPAEPVPPIVAPAHETAAAPTSLPPMLHPEPAPDTHVFTIKPYGAVRFFPFFEGSFVIYAVFIISFFTNWKWVLFASACLAFNIASGYLITKKCKIGVTASELYYDNPFNHRFIWKLEYIKSISHTHHVGYFHPIIPEQDLNLLLVGRGRNPKSIGCQQFRSLDLDRITWIVQAAKEKRPGWWK
jgi:hypothetical protein